MRVRHEILRLTRFAAVGGAVVALWIVATIPSGFSASQLLFFAGPGIVLAVAVSWTAHAFTPERWAWDDALSAAAAGASLFPPIVGLFVAWSTTFSPNVMIFLLVLASWLALAGGLIAASAAKIALLTRGRHQHRAARAAHDARGDGSHHAAS